MAVLGQLPEHVEIGLGVVSTLPGEVDSPETIVRSRRTGSATRRARAHRTESGMWIRAGGQQRRWTLNEVYTKLKNEVAAAKMLRAKYE